MSNQTRTRQQRPAATPLAALCAAVLVLFAIVAPVWANEGPTGLVDPTISPRTGTPSTTISFAVTYRNHEGSAPGHVSVVIDGTAQVMSGGGGTNWKSGVVYRWSTTLAAGSHAISFEAAGKDKFSNTASGGTVTITAPPPPLPTPTPKPTPGPTSTPTPAPTPTATPAPTRTPGPEPTPTPRPTATPTPRPTATPTPQPDATSTPDRSGTGGSGSGGSPGGSTGSVPPGDPGSFTGGTGATGGTHGTGASGGSGGTTTDLSGTGAGRGWSDGSGDGSGRSTDVIGSNGTGLAGAGPIAGVDGGTDGSTGSSGTSGSANGDPSTTSGGGREVVVGSPGWGALASALATLGIDRPPSITMLPMLVGTSTAMTMAFAFAIFGKKRRDEQPPAPDEVLQANAARGHGAVPGGEVMNGVVRASTIPAPLDIEAGMPRWRRPSLLEARKADPTRSVAGSHRMSFERGSAGGSIGRERRVVRYSVVRLLDAPDELRSAEIGQIDQGDEVQLIERSGSYWLVLCPDGRQGWIHKMTLGDIVTDAPAASLARDVDDDVLTAFLTARARA